MEPLSYVCSVRPKITINKDNSIEFDTGLKLPDRMYKGVELTRFEEPIEGKIRRSLQECLLNQQRKFFQIIDIDNKGRSDVLVVKYNSLVRPEAIRFNPTRSSNADSLDSILGKLFKQLNFKYKVYETSEKELEWVTEGIKSKSATRRPYGTDTNAEIATSIIGSKYQKYPRLVSKFLFDMYLRFPSFDFKQVRELYYSTLRKSPFVLFENLSLEESRPMESLSSSESEVEPGQRQSISNLDAGSVKWDSGDIYTSDDSTEVESQRRSSSVSSLDRPAGPPKEEMEIQSRRKSIELPIEQPRKVSLKPVEQPRKASIKPVEQPRKASVKPVEQPRKASIRSVEQPRKASIKPVKQPRRVSVRSVEQPRKASIKSVAQPRRVSVRSVEQPRRASIKPVEQPRRVSVRSVEQPRKASVKPVEQPRKSSVRSVEQPRKVSKVSDLESEQRIRTLAAIRQLKRKSSIVPVEQQKESARRPSVKPVQRVPLVENIVPQEPSQDLMEKMERRRRMDEPIFEEAPRKRNTRKRKEEPVILQQQKNADQELQQTFKDFKIRDPSRAKVINPLTGNCIFKDGAVYIKLIKQGIPLFKFQDC